MNCPDCGGETWDNGPKKRSGEFKANAPNHSCKNKACGWNDAPWRVKPTVKRAEGGTVPAPPGASGQVQEAPHGVIPVWSDVMREKVSLFDRCFKHVTALVGANNSAKDPPIVFTDESAGKLISTLFIGLKD